MKTSTIEVTVKSLASGEDTLVTVTATRGTIKEKSSLIEFDLNDDITPETHPQFFHESEVKSSKIVADMGKYGSAEVTIIKKFIPQNITDRFGENINLLEGEVFFEGRRRRAAAVISKEDAERIEKAFKEACAEAEKDEDYFEYNKKQDMPVALDIIKRGDEEIKRSGKLMTREEVKVARKKYNDQYNEGGEGFVPSFVSIEDYNKAKEIVEMYNTNK